MINDFLNGSAEQSHCYREVIALFKVKINFVILCKHVEEFDFKWETFF